MAVPNPPPGPAPMAQMYEDDVDMADETSSDTSMLSEVASATTTSDEVSDSSAEADWSAIGVDFITTQEALVALGERKPIPRPPSPPAPAAGPAPPFHPPPQRIPLNGVKTYVQWIPYWCDPEWNDEHYKFDEDGKATHWVKIHPLDKQRPALLPKDSLKNPTPYAKRFGIHLDQLNGRSRMSPSNSTTRQVKLTQAQPTPTGVKDYITVEDVRTFLRMNNRDDIESSSEYIKSLYTSQTGNTEQIEAYLQLQDMLEQDEALQQAAFANTTSDERIAHDAHSLDPIPVKYDLDGPLHPLLSRERWMSPVTRGDVEEEPRYLYNLHGNRGEWCAQNEIVWAALQPAFQVVTRILNTNHPFWLALLNAKSRKRIDPSRLAYGATSALETNWISFTTHFDQAQSVTGHPEQVGSRAIDKIDYYGYDLPRAAAEFLSQRLRLDFFSSAESWKKGTPLERITWGETMIFCMDNPSTAGVLVVIGAEMLWPLLTPELTHKEKACCTMMIAATILHELAHAAHMAMMGLLSLAHIDYHDSSSPLCGVPVDLMAALKKLGEELTSDHEPFYEDEPVQECGFSFENALFGGTIDSAFSTSGPLYAHHTLMPITILLGNWPTRHRPHLEDEKILLNPPLPVDKISTLLPTGTYSRFFDQTFWNSEVLKYGHQALKMHPDTGSLTILKRGYKRNKDLQRVFGKSHGEWLSVALRFLKQLGHGVLYAYCREVMHETMESIWVRKRFHHECKVWPSRNEVFDKIVDRIHRHTSALYTILHDANSTYMEKLQKIDRENEAIFRAVQSGEISDIQQSLDMNGYISRLFHQLIREFNALIGSYKELHHHILHEIRCIQTLVVDYVQQTPLARTRLHGRYGGSLYTKIEEIFEPVIADILQTLEQIRQQFKSAAALTEELDDDIERSRNYLQLDLNHLSKTKSYLSEDNANIENLFWEGELETIPRGREKKKSQTMKRMATKEILRADPAIRTLVDTFLAILSMNSDDAKAEEDARSLERVTERIQKDLQANQQRKTQAAGHPGWLLPTPSRTPSRTPEQSGIGYHRPPGNTVPPWQAAPTPPPSAAARGLLFGQPNSITPVATPPLSPRLTATFAKYASKTNAFPTVSESESVLRQQPMALDTDDTVSFDPDAGVGFGGGPPLQPGWGPFGTAWSDSRTVTEELIREGVPTPDFRNVFGHEVYLRRMAAEDAARRNLHARKTGYYP